MIYIAAQELKKGQPIRILQIIQSPYLIQDIAIIEPASAIQHRVYGIALANTKAEELAPVVTHGTFIFVNTGDNDDVDL